MRLFAKLWETPPPCRAPNKGRRRQGDRVATAGAAGLEQFNFRTDNKANTLRDWLQCKKADQHRELIILTSFLRSPQIDNLVCLSVVIISFGDDSFSLANWLSAEHHHHHHLWISSARRTPPWSATISQHRGDITEAQNGRTVRRGGHSFDFHRAFVSIIKQQNAAVSVQVSWRVYMHQMEYFNNSLNCCVLCVFYVWLFAITSPNY